MADAEENEKPDEASETDEADAAEFERHVERLAQALSALDDSSLERALRAMNNEARRELASNLNLPPATAQLGQALPSLVRRKLGNLHGERQLTVGFAIADGPNDATVAALGDRHEDPSKDDMLEVLPSIVENFGSQLVTLMLATYAVSDAPCRDVMIDLLEHDERFVPGAPIEPPSLTGGGPTTHSHGHGSDSEQREKRKANKSKRRENADRQRAQRAQADLTRKQAQRRSRRGS